MPANKRMTAEELDAKINELIAHCEKTGDPPSDFLVLQIVGLPPYTLSRWRHDDENEKRKKEAKKEKTNYRANSNSSANSKSKGKEKKEIYKERKEKENDSAETRIAGGELTEEENDNLPDDMREIVSPYAIAIKKLELYRNHYWLNLGKDNPKLQGFVAFNLKQPGNGGYTDKPAQITGSQIEVTINTKGVGGDDAFK